MPGGLQAQGAKGEAQRLHGTARQGRGGEDKRSDWMRHKMPEAGVSVLIRVRADTCPCQHASVPIRFLAHTCP